MHSPARRRELGSFYTPVDVAERLVAIALDGIEGAPVVCDPSCGDGVFLLAAARALEARGLDRSRIALDLLWGVDVDARAVDAASEAIAAWAGVSPGDHLRVADGLDDLGWSARFDVVVGNPPFLNQLQRATVRARPTRWDECSGAYTDTAFLFMLVGLDLVRDGGRVVLVQPQSFAAARDAAGVRDAIGARGAVTGMWTCDELVFDASVRVCAPVIERGASPAHAVPRWHGREVTEAAPVATPSSDTWSRLLVRADEAPAVDLVATDRLGSIASATAGFRDQFYGLTDHVVDREDADEHEWPRLVTCGAIDPAACTWGARSVRYAGRRWQHPRVDVAGIGDAAVRQWVLDRLVPKVVLATQTKVLEAAVDVEGTWVPSTPVIAVHAAPDALFRVLAVLLAPPVSAWAASGFAGTALASDAIKLSARQVLEAPLPVHEAPWAEAASALCAGDVYRAGALMTTAYNADDDVFEWWTRRLPVARAVTTQ